MPGQDARIAAAKSKQTVRLEIRAYSSRNDLRDAVELPSIARDVRDGVVIQEAQGTQHDAVVGLALLAIDHHERDSAVARAMHLIRHVMTVRTESHVAQSERVVFRPRLAVHVHAALVTRNEIDTEKKTATPVFDVGGAAAIC